MQYLVANENASDESILWHFEQNFIARFVCSILHFSLKHKGWNVLQRALQLFTVCFQVDMFLKFHCLVNKLPVSYTKKVSFLININLFLHLVSVGLWRDH